MSDGRRRTRLCVRGAGLVILAAGLPALAACGEPGGEAGSGAAITAETPWVRVAILPAGSDAPDAPPVNSAAYLVLDNPTGSADALVAVETTVADTAEIHSVSMEGGVMRMRPVDSVPIPAGGRAVLEPGGYHIMLIGIHRPLSQGSHVDLRLRLGSGRVLEVSAPVLRAPPS